MLQWLTESSVLRSGLSPVCVLYIQVIDEQVEKGEGPGDTGDRGVPLGRAVIDTHKEVYHSHITAPFTAVTPE